MILLFRTLPKFRKCFIFKNTPLNFLCFHQPFTTEEVSISHYETTNSLNQWIRPNKLLSFFRQMQVKFRACLCGEMLPLVERLPSRVIFYRAVPAVWPSWQYGGMNNDHMKYVSKVFPYSCSRQAQRSV